MERDGEEEGRSGRDGLQSLSHIARPPQVALPIHAPSPTRLWKCRVICSVNKCCRLLPGLLCHGKSCFVIFQS